MVSPKIMPGLPFLQRAQERAEEQRRQRITHYQKQYATDVPSRLPDLADSSPVHVCPLSSVPFSGQCPVRTCPGNKPGFENGGCLYLFYGRTKLDKADIMFSYKLNEKKLHDNIAQGQERVVQAIGFYKTLNDLRNQDTLGHCPHCGVGHRKGVYRCENTALCEDRKTFAESFIKTSNLAFVEIQGSPRDVYLIAREKDRFQKLADATHTNMSQLLGIGQDQLKALSETIALT
jgi:hypothetical protein